MKTYWGSGHIAPPILNLGIRWGWEPLVPIEYEAEWAPKRVWTRWRKKIPTPAGNRTPVFQHVA